MSNLRKVHVFKQVRRADGLGFDRTFETTGEFHQWGQDYEEFETGPGNFSTAIVELPDGTVQNVPVEMIAFVDQEEYHELSRQGDVGTNA